MARPLQEINAGSMADIAFLLLIFFLVTTTMDIDSGILRQLPPPKPDKEEPQDPIKERNVYIVLINSFDQLAVEGELMHVSKLCDGVKEFITNPKEKENLSEKREKDNPLFGKIEISKGVVSLQNDRSTSYARYIQVQNELVRAFNELRDEFSMRRFGMHFNELDEEKQDAVKAAIPITISEAEPKNIGG
ncbi:MAG: biopolymer transporter ExbD [Bacteroidales bacterium]|nr:biopolymer transporter ExbD [Bacteroidales bacterium]